MVYQLKRTQINKRPQAFWGSLIPSALSFVGGLITSSQQAKAQRRALEEQKRLAQQQLDISNQNQLAATLNNYASAQQSYDDKDYNLKYRIGGVKRLGGRNIMITDGGTAKRIGNNTYLLRGGSHEDINETGQTGIGINVGGNEIEAEGGEVAQRKGNSLRIYSAQPILGGISPAEAIIRGYNKDRVFNAQQRFKKNNGIKDDGNKAQVGGYYGANYPSPLSLLSILYDKTLGRFDDKNPNLQTGIAPTPSRSLNLKQVRGGLVNRNMLRTNRVYRIADMREVKDAKTIGQYRKLPEGVTIPTKIVRTRSGRTFEFGKAGGNSHGGKAAAMGEPWTGTTSGGYNESKYIISTPSRHTTWSVGHAGSYSKPLPADAIKKGSGLWKKFDTEGNTGISTKRMVVYKDLGNGRYLRLPKSKYRLGGGLTSKDRGSSKHPYPSVSSKDFAGGNRSYPIPTKADAIDALRLAGLHGRSDVRSKVYSKYPELRPKAKRFGGLTNPPVERFKCGGRIRPKAGKGMLASIYSHDSVRRGLPSFASIYSIASVRRGLPSFAPIDITPRAIPNFKPIPVPTNTKTPFDLNSVPYLGKQSSFKPATQDYIGLGIDTLAALGSGMFTRSAYNKMNFDYALPNYVDESPVAFDTTYHNEAQRANIERNRLNARNLIRGNTASAQTALGRMQQSDVDAMMETNKLLDEKSNKEVELRNQNAANEQQVRARNAAARNQYYQNVAQIKNAALEAKNNMELAKAQSIGADLSGLSQAWTNFAGSIENRYDNRQKEAIIAATAKNPDVLSNAVQFGYNFSPEVLAAIYNSTDDDNLKSLALSQLSTKNRLRYGIR
nr:MAG: hypothetical protein [Bacteriophage sp.]